MKSFFQRKNDTQAGPSKSAATKEPYKLWMPRPELEVSQRPDRTEKREARSSSRLPAEKPPSSSRAPPASTAHRAHKYAAATPAVTSTASQRVSQAYPISSNVPAPSMNNYMDPSYNLRTANVAKTYASSTANGFSGTMYPTASTSTAAVTAIPPPPEMGRASSSYSRRDRDREPSDKYGDRIRDRSDRERDRSDKERDRSDKEKRESDRTREKERARERSERDRGAERNKERTRDREKERERERERPRDRERDRDRDRARRPEHHVDPIVTTERIRESTKLRDTDSVFRGIRDADRTRARERDIPRNDERMAREKPSSKDAERYRESSRRPSDWDAERRADTDRQSRHRRTERERDKGFVGVTKSTGKDSSDEAESSDASKHKYGMSSSAYRRTKTKDPIPTSSWNLPSTMSSEQPYGRAPIPSSTIPYAGPVPPSNSMPYNGYPVPPSSKTQDPSTRGGFPVPSVSKPNQDSVPSHALFSPEPLPVLLPVRIPESHPVRVVTPSQPPPMDNSPSVENKTTRRGERYGSSAVKASRDKDQELANTLQIPSSADERLETSAPSRRPQGVSSGGTRDKSTSGPSSSAVPQSSSSSYPVRSKVAESVSYELAHDNPGTISRNEPAASSSRHRNIDQSAAGSYVPSASRTRKVSSASQQAAQQASMTVSSAPNHSSRRERDKGSKHQSSREARHQDASAVRDPPPQNAETSSSSLLFQGSHIAAPTPAPAINNSPHISIRFTPPTPAKRSPSVLDERLALGNNNTFASDTLAPPQHGGTPKIATRSSEYIPYPSQPIQPTREVSQGSKVAQIVAGYESRPSPAMEKSNLSTPLTTDLIANTLPQNKAGTPLSTPQIPVAPYNSSPSFKVAVSSNERGRTVSISASNEGGSPYKSGSAGSNTGPHLTAALPAADTPSSKHSIQVPSTPISHPSPFIGSAPSNPTVNGFQAQPPPLRENYRETNARSSTNKHAMPDSSHPSPFIGSAPSNPMLVNGFQAQPPPLRENYRETNARSSTSKHAMPDSLPSTSRTVPATVSGNNGNSWSTNSQAVRPPDETKDQSSRSGPNSRPYRGGVSKASEQLPSWSTQTDRNQSSVYASANPANAFHGPSALDMARSLPPSQINTTYSNGPYKNPPPKDVNTGLGGRSIPPRSFTLDAAPIPIPPPNNVTAGPGGRNIPPRSFTPDTTPIPVPPPNDVTAGPGGRNIPPRSFTPSVAPIPIPYRQNGTNVNGSMFTSQETFYPAAPLAGVRNGNGVNTHSNMASRGVSDPVERSGSTVPFSHPKLAELMSDTTSPTWHAPEPVIAPLKTDFLPTVQPSDGGKQDEWMLPSPSKYKDRSSPVVEGYPDLHSSPYKDPRAEPQPYLEVSRKNPNVGVAPSDMNHPIAPSSSKPTSSTMAYALFSQADAAKNSGVNNVTTHARVSSHPDTIEAPPRPPSTRPTQAWSSGAPALSSTYPGNNRTGHTRPRTKLPEPETFMNPAPLQSVPSSNSAHPDVAPNVKATSYLQRAPSEESILKTPSSLANSVLKPTVSRTSIPVSTSSSSQQDSRKKGFFGMFKSRAPSNQTQPATENPYEVWKPSLAQDSKPDAGPVDAEPKPPIFKSRTPSSQTQTDNSYEVWNPPVAYQLRDKPGGLTDTKPSIVRSKVPPPITVPISIPITERKSPNHKVFTPFRYLSSKRNRTVSAASVEAVDGTAPNTVVGSPTASMNSSQPPIQPPPVRDSQQATHEWRERKESETRNARYRVQRPGVVFDVPQDPSQDKQNLRYVRTSRSARTSNV